MKCYCGNETKRKAKYCSYRCRNLCLVYQENKRQSLLKKTGYEHQSQNPAVKEKKKKTFLERYGVEIGFQTQGDLSGEKNPFYGKKHTEESLSKIRKLTREEASRRRKVKSLCYGLLWRFLRQRGETKSAKCYEMLGYTPKQLREHLESLFKPGMSWENHGSGEGKWQIDHVRPVCSFPEGTPANVINALENLQPLWTKENLEKGAKI